MDFEIRCQGDEGGVLMDKKFKICEQAKSYAEKKGIKNIDFNSIKELVPAERFNVWTAAEQLGEYDFGFDLEKVGIEVYEKGEDLKIEIFRNASYTDKLELIKLTFTITGWEIDIADGDLDFTFDVKEIPGTWIYAECECLGHYK